MRRKHERGDGASDNYMRTIRGYAPLTLEDEARLSRDVHHGTQEERRKAVEALICSNLRLVVKIAHDFKDYGLPFQDLVSEGNMGLMTAAERFDPSKGAKFSCYAAWWIKQQMRKAISFQSQMIRVPSGSMQDMFNAWKARSRFFAENMREPTVEELSEITRLAPVTLERLSTIDAETVSLDDKVAPAESDSTFEDVLSEQPRSEENPMVGKLRGALEQCTPLEKHLLRGYFGIDCAEPKTITTLAEEMGIPLQRVSERLQQALVKLRGMLTVEPDEDFTLGV